MGAALSGGAVIVLDGDLGAGKTQFSKGVARSLGVTSTLTSPTFNLVLEYPVGKQDAHREHDSGSGSQGDASVVRMLRHFDLYRFEHAEELEDIDYFGLIEQQDVVSLIEWGSKFASHLPLDYLLVHIALDKDASNKRHIEIRAEGPLSQELLERLFSLREEQYRD